MPVPLRTIYHKAEAKYNVTTEFPSLGLHSAAATGNVGLVEYALDHGQPINSVLDGVLPLHAACAGGNVQVVKLLIDHGADVNAPRLPRRYSNDKNRDTSAPIVGTSGSTPLHFAAANGNTDVVTLLLLHGAHANRSDKHGITPEMLARQNGWLECADVLRQWVLNKDRDLRERPSGFSDAMSTNGFASREHLGSLGAEGEASVSSSMRRRIHMKHSIDTALNMLKSSSTETYLKPPPPSSSATNLASILPSDEYALQPMAPSDDEQSSPGGSRRPSLPHVFPHSSSIGHPHTRKTPTSANSGSSPRRPRSAGTDAENQEQELSHSALGRGAVRKLGSKYSLMNIFKKAQSGEVGSAGQFESSQSILDPSSPPSFGSTIALPLSTSPKSANFVSNPSSSSTNLIENMTSSISGPSISRTGFRFHRGSDASARANSQHSQPPQSLHQKTPAALNSPTHVSVPLAVDLHNALAQQQHDRHQHRQTRDRSRSTGSSKRFSPDEIPKASPSPNSSPVTRLGILRARGRDRSGSGASLGTDSSPGHRGGSVFDDDVVVTLGDSGGDVGSGKAGPRPGILRAHNRTSSSGQAPGITPGFRALRFDSTFSGSSGALKDSESRIREELLPLRSSNSAGSLVGFGQKINAKRSDSVEPKVTEEEDSLPESALAAKIDLDVPSDAAIEREEIPDEEEEREFKYGRPLIREELDPVVDSTILNGKPPALHLRDRGLSFGSSSESSLSPILSNENTIAEGTSSLMNSEFPFSINRPPPMLLEGESAGPTQDLLRVPSPGDNRRRGDSVSSTSTSDSRNNPQLSNSGTTSGSGGSETVTTPVFTPSGRDQFLRSNPAKDDEPLDTQQNQDGSHIEERQSNNPTGISTVNERRSRTPLDINISSISSHAQAEALVQKAQQDILEMAHAVDLAPATGSTGRSPLSARLAAYGESLALERKLREQKQAEDERMANDDMMPSSPVPSKAETFMHDGNVIPKSAVRTRRDGVERQHSLETKSGLPRLKPRVKDPRRPSTAEGLSPRHTGNLFPDDQTGRSHHFSRSASGFGPSPSSGLSFEQEIGLPKEPDVYPNHSQSPALPKIMRDQESSPAYNRTLNRSRSRTPVVDPDHGQLSRISSLDCLDTDTEMGPPLFRVSTAPHTGPSPTRGKREQAKSANKLTRMGFSPSEQAGRAVPLTTGSKRFGAIKHLMQTLTGKS